ncbi:MAG: hypothetical protein ACLTMP_08725 [Eggerthella lenta]
MDTAVLYLRIMQRERAVLRGHVQLRLVRIGARHATARVSELADRRVRRALRLAFLLSGVLGFGYVGIFVAQAASPVMPALIGAPLPAPLDATRDVWGVTRNRCRRKRALLSEKTHVSGDNGNRKQGATR